MAKNNSTFSDAPLVVGGHLPAQRVSVKVMSLNKLMNLVDALDWLYSEATGGGGGGTCDPEWVEEG